MPRVLAQADNSQGATVLSMMEAMTQDFGELAFGGVVDLDSQAKEVLAAGWRNLWNISMMLATKK